MDLAAFEDDDFDATDWVNSMYENSDVKNKQAFVANLLAKVQCHIEEVGSSLEDTTQEVLITLPKVMKDTQILKQEVESLRSEMSKVQAEISKVQDDTGAVMANLEELDALRTKMEIAKHGLMESDGWGRSVAELEDFFEKNDLQLICTKLGALQKSLAAQEGLPGQSERENQVEGFKNRLEALASPSMVESFSVNDIEQSKKFVEIFTNMNRLPQLTQYYRTVQKTSMQQHWNEILDLSENSNRFMHDFYEYLAENYQKQSQWCIKVFGPMAYTEALLVLIELLPGLQPTRQTSVLAALKNSNEKLEVLAEFSNANVHFSLLLSKYFQQTQFPDNTYMTRLTQSVFDYFHTFIAQYPAIEQNYLATNLANLNINRNTAGETIRNLGNGNQKVLEWLNAALERCEQITQNCAIAPLAIVLNSILKTYFEKYKRAQQQLTASKNLEQDWSLLQSCMSLLQNIGDLKVLLLEFDKKFAGKVIVTQDKLHQIDDTYLGYKLKERRDFNDLKKLYLKVKDSDRNLGKVFVLFSSVNDLMKPICVETHDTTLAAVFAPIERQFLLQNVEPTEMLNVSGSDLPDYSFAPQEFITQVGQYLLTLPQHLEPLLLSPSSSLKLALEICDEKYTQNIPSADILLSLVVEECCAMYQNQLFKIQSVGVTGAKQLATDIDYLGSVLEELGLSFNNHLQQMATLLRAPTEKYLTLSSGCEPRLVTAIRQMRGIISTD